MWGIRLFDESQTAEDRRTYRTSRRRIQRRRERLALLEMLFNEEISKVDPAFFIRLKESNLLIEDREDINKTGKYTVFNDKDYNDKDFHNVFNQYNLSCDLMEPFRTIVDHSVKKMNPEKFEREEKINILNILNLEMKIDGKTNTMLNAVKIYSKSIFDALEQDDMSLLRMPVINNEL